MPRYKVNKRYAAMYNAARLEYSPPAEVDLPEAQADWVNRDCPGTLTLVEPESAHEPPAAEPETTQAEDEQDTADGGQEAAEEPAAAEKPARNRAHTPSRTRK